jgi:hypothetical protein
MMGLTTDYTCRLKIEWTLNGKVSQGGRVSGSFTKDEKEFVVVKWHKGKFKEALAKIRGKSKWSEVRYNNTKYFTKEIDKLEVLQTKLEGETERGMLFLRVDDVSTFQQH